MTQDSSIKTPRLYSPIRLHKDETVEIDSPDQAHYLKNVLRRATGDYVRIFNGYDGEWLCEIQTLNKRGLSVTPTRQTRAQSENTRRIHVYFAPIKKQRMDFLIEKAVELGASDLHPILTQNTETRKINESRILAQIIEAAEQCERLDIPHLHPLVDMHAFLSAPLPAPLYAALERGDHQNARAALPENGHIAILIGPEGGFTQNENERVMQTPSVTPVSLGNSILRAETALLKMLSLL